MVLKLMSGNVLKCVGPGDFDLLAYRNMFSIRTTIIWSLKDMSKMKLKLLA